MSNSSRIFNFSAGPAVLPLEALQEAQADLVNYRGSGMSVMEMSHRGKEYMAIQDEAQANVRELLALSDDYEVLFLQGGASLQFAMLPMNFLGRDTVADYVNSGTWGSKAIKEAHLFGKVNVAADCEKDIPTRMPELSELNWTPGAAYAHITSNETIAGAQWKTFPVTEAPLVAVLVTLHCLREPREPRSALFWIYLAWALPVVGALLYLAFGINRLPAKGWQKQRSDQAFWEMRRSREEDSQPLASPTPPGIADRRRAGGLFA